MIGVRFQGRLGNQLFQYAFGITLEKRLNTTFFVDDTIQQNYLNQYFTLRKFKIKYLVINYIFFKEIIKNLIKSKSFESFLNNYVRHNYLKEINRFPIIQQAGGDIPLKWRKNIIDNALYVGFFQSSQYLIDLTDIRRHFTIKSKYRRQYEKRYKKIFNKYQTIVAHIRRTDYLDWGSDELGGDNLTLPLEYYFNCMAEIVNIEQYKIFFISDDIGYVKRNIKERQNFYFESNDEIIDFQLLLNADVLILANSSFSWWGAFLNSKENKKVYVPKNWLGFKSEKEYPIGIIEKSWKQIEINSN